MSKKITSRTGLFGTTVHYDEKGRKIGESRPGFFGGEVHYDAKGRKVGKSQPGLFGGNVNYDANGHRVGRTENSFFGSQVHYDSKGHKIGRTDTGLFGVKKKPRALFFAEREAFLNRRIKGAAAGAARRGAWGRRRARARTAPRWTARNRSARG